MTYHRENKELQIIHHLLLKSPFRSHLGLLKGKMGIALMFFLYGRAKKSDVYSDYASELLDDIWSEIGTNETLFFAEGLCGIGWGIEYLIQHGYVDGDTNEICEDIDRKVEQMDLSEINDFSIEYGLGGILAYINAREQGNILQQKPSPFNEYFRNTFSQKCKTHPNTFIIQGKVQLDPLKKIIKPIKRVTMDMNEDCPIGLNGMAGHILINL